jgi:hypothetical protein
MNDTEHAHAEAIRHVDWWTIKEEVWGLIVRGYLPAFVKALDERRTNAGRAYITQALASFDNDPADSDFQLGYLAALRIIGREALGMEIADPEVQAGERIERPKLSVIDGGTQDDIKKTRKDHDHIRLWPIEWADEKITVDEAKS